MSRAALLLRLATSSAQQMLRDADVTNTDLAFWWKTFGTERGMWPSDAPLSDLQTRGLTCLAGLMRRSLARIGRSPLRRSSICATPPPFALGLGSFEFISLWGLAS